jgi:NitT/TauT family transport system ATP-binding protein
LPPPPLVSLAAVGKVYANGTRALAGIDLDLTPGTFLAVLGPSGCGKSTLLRLIAGLDAASEGRLDRDPALAQPGAVGCVFQDPTLLPWADAAGNVRLPLRLMRVPAAAAADRATEALARVGLAGFARARPQALSGGMRMRVAIARALVTRPRLLLLDEPFAALDEITRFRLNDDLNRLWRETGITVVFVTHSVAEAVFLASRIVVLAPRPGRIHADLSVDLPAERQRPLRSDPAYVGRCRDVGDRLEAAMAAADDGDADAA